MSSLHVSLTVGHQTSVPHPACSLDPQMRVFSYRPLDPFDSSLTMTDLLRAAGNLLDLARSGLCWGRQFFAAPPFPPSTAAQPKNAKPYRQAEQAAEADPKSADPPVQPPSEASPEAPPPPVPEPHAGERIRRSRETGRRTMAEAQEGLGKAPKEERARKRTEAPNGSYPYGLHLALELAIDRSRGPEPVGREERRSERHPPGVGLPLSFRGTLSLHLPLTRPAPTGRGGRAGR